MTSNIFYKFKSYKNYSSIPFEGTSMPLWELKYEIVTQRKMISNDFDLLFFDGGTEEQLTDEYLQISRNSHIVVHKIPLWMSKSGFTMRERRPDSSNMTKRFHKDPPENYVCFRCGNKGHFIQHCPTNADKNFDILKVKKPSGIPKDFLVKVDGEVEGGKSVLVTDEGFVKANPQTQEWQKQGTMHNYSEVPEDLKCVECHKLARNPVRTNCGHLFCEGCVSISDRCVYCSKTVSKLHFDDNILQKIQNLNHK